MFINMNGPPPAGLVSFQVSTKAATITPAEMVERLGAQDVWIRDLADPICLRACTHVSTTPAELKTLTQALHGTLA